MQVPIPICAKCIHFNEKKWTCEPFPDGIPDKILIGEHDHTKPFPGDNGIRFEPIEEKD